jgi:D-alanyl-D-alanine carboxypeptidase
MVGNSSDMDSVIRTGMSRARTDKPRAWHWGWLIAAALLSFAAASPAFAANRAAAGAQYFAPHFSDIVIDAQTGQILDENDADRPNYPASLTKMMTLYLTFEALEQGKITLNDYFTVSLHAARMAPSKIDLQPGERIQVHNLILGIVTKSANDAAVTVGENMAGSEDAFAERMTAKAHQLGMTNTTFRNASGLPNPGQITTARDLSKLARALWHDFPKEYAFFATEEFVYRDVLYETHNHLMHEFEGMDGIKTGYIHASGFNLAASAMRNGRRLIGVIMGGTSAHGRDMQMAQLLEAGFSGTIAQPVQQPELRTALDTTTATDEGAYPGKESLPRRAARTFAARTLAALNPVGRAEAATQRSYSKHRKLSAVATPASGWSIQVGAFATREAAESAGHGALLKLPAAKGKAALVVAPAPGDKESLYRARIAGFTQADAQKACRSLHKSLGNQQKLCAVIAPQTQAIALSTALPASPADPAAAPPAAAAPAAAPAPAPAMDAPTSAGPPGN